MQEPIEHINCPKCNAATPVFSKHAELRVCPACYKIFTPSLGVHSFSNNHDYAEYCAELPLGTRFKHNNVVYAVRGKVVKYEENDHHAIWCEYMLTNPENENLYLSCWNGHWSLVEFLPDFDAETRPSRYMEDVPYEGVNYTYFHKYKARFAYLEGEFNFNVFEEDKKGCFEYINPPYTLIFENEKGVKKFNAYRSTYLYKSEVKRKLVDKTSLSGSNGIAGNQPFYWNINPTFFFRGSVVMFFILLLFQFIIRYAYPTVLITRSSYTLTSEDTAKTYSSASFNVPYNGALMNMVMHCDYLDNDWVSTYITLVNDDSGEERNFEMGAEHYAGYTDGESWSEGSYEAKGNITGLEKGRYHFEITPYQQLGSRPKPLTVNAEVFKGSWSVFWVMTIVLIVANIILGLMHDYFEHAKWGEDYDTFDFLFDN